MKQLTVINRGSLKDLTFCIFTLERKFDLERLVNFLSISDAEVIVLDASVNPVLLQNRGNFTYLHVPNMPIQERMRQFSELAKTKYILLSPDDDFWALNGLVKTLNFLDRNSDYASAQGLRIRFFDFPLFHWIPDYVNQMTLDYNQEAKRDRLLKMATGFHYIYSIIRKEEFRKVVDCFSTVNSTKRNSVMMAELVFNYALPALGKHKLLPVFYSARKSHPYEGGDVDFGKWINDKTDMDAERFKINVVNLYQGELSVDENEAEKIFWYLTKKFSKIKQVPVKKFQRFKMVMRYLFGTTELRSLRKFTKIKYFSFYVLLFKNNSFILFIKDLNCIKKHLKENRITT